MYSQMGSGRWGLHLQNKPAIESATARKQNCYGKQAGNLGCTDLVGEGRSKKCAKWPAGLLTVEPFLTLPLISD